MSVIATIECRKHAFRMRRIADHLVEINNCIVRAAGSDPVIDRMALCFLFWRVESRCYQRVFKGQDGTAEGCEAPLVCSLDELQQAGYNIFGADVLRWRRNNSRMQLTTRSSALVSAYIEPALPKGVRTPSTKTTSRSSRGMTVYYSRVTTASRAIG